MPVLFENICWRAGAVFYLCRKDQKIVFMKSELILFFSIVLLTALGCSPTLSTKFNYDEQTDFSKYKTFAIKDFTRQGDVFFMNELNRRRITNMVTGELEGKGLTMTESNPDLLVYLQSIVQTKEGVVDPMASVPYGRSLIYNQPQPQVYTYDQGSLVVDLVDAARQEAVWEGVSKMIIDKDDQIKNAEEQLRKIVSKIMAGYPPRK